jgi:hypothetical protein
MRSTLAFVFAALGMVGCAHHPDTVVHLSSPNAAGWSVREPRGAHVCSLPCSVELYDHETLVVHHPAGKQFVLDQDTLGKGVWSGAVTQRKEPGHGAIFLQAFSNALATTGAKIASEGRSNRASAGIVLVGVGAAGSALAEMLPGKTAPELRLEKIARE